MNFRPLFSAFLSHAQPPNFLWPFVLILSHVTLIRPRPSIIPSPSRTWICPGKYLDAIGRMHCTRWASALVLWTPEKGRSSRRFHIKAEHSYASLAFRFWESWFQRHLGVFFAFLATLYIRLRSSQTGSVSFENLCGLQLSSSVSVDRRRSQLTNIFSLLFRAII